MNRSRIWIPEHLLPGVTEEISANIPLKIGLQGMFTAELMNRSGDVVGTWKFSNVITNAFMNGIGSGSFGVNGIYSALNRMRVGTGSAIPSGTDTNLQAPIGNFVTSNGGIDDQTGFMSGSGTFDNYQWFQRSRLFDFNDASGNITEIAWFTTTNNTAIVRSLVRDSFGTPTSIPKTNDEQLRIRYEMRMIVPITTSSFNIVIGNTTHSAVIYPNDVDAPRVNLTNWAFLFDAFGGTSWQGTTQIHCVTYQSWSIAGGTWNPFTPINVVNRADQDTRSAAIYVNDSFFRQTTHSFAATNATINSYPSGILAVGLSPVINTAPSNFYNINYPWFITFNPPIIKTDTQRLNFFVRWQWARSGTESL